MKEIIVKRLGTRNSRRINSLVDNIIRTSSAGNVGISDDMQEVWVAEVALPVFTGRVGS